MKSKKPWKQCLSYGCGELIREGGYCSKHKDERVKQYDKYERNQESRRFYQSSNGKRVRAYVLARDSNLCQQCLKDKKFTQADVCDTTTSKSSQNTSKSNDNLGLVDYMNSKRWIQV